MYRKHHYVSLGLVSSVVLGCAQPPQEACDTCDSLSSNNIVTNQSSSQSLFALAAPASAQLEAPWDARDTDILRIARTRAPDSDFVKAAVFETVTPCANGGTQTDIQNNEPPPWYSQGDSYTTVFVACVVGDTQTDGQKAYSVDVLTGQPYIDPTWSTGTTISRDLTKTNVVTGEVSFVIDSMSEQTSVVDNTQYTQVFANSSSRNWFNGGVEQIGNSSSQVTYSWDETTQQFQWDFDVSSGNTLFGDSSAVTLQTLTGTIGTPPDAGQFQTIKTEAGVTSTSTITATGGGTVLIETDSDGDGVIDSTSNSTWDQLLLDPALMRFI